MSETSNVSTPAMSEEDRLALASKLDQELDEFINGLERKKYEDGWPADRWEEEMEKHPFFMKKLPEPGDEVHPLYEGMQQLKFDPDENTTEDLTTKYKEDGNFYLKHKKLRLAVMSYTEGLHLKCQNQDLNATLYNNRSAAQFFLKNFRSSFDDAMKALTLKPDYAKAKWRAAQCADKLDRFEKCVDLCDQILHDDPGNSAAKELRKKCVARQQTKLRNERKLTNAEKKKLEEKEKVLKIIKIRKLKFEELSEGEEITFDVLKPTYPPLEDFPVHIDMNGALEWPVTFCYPEFLFSDFQQQVCEEFPMEDIIHDLFLDPLECDREKNYVHDNVKVYYENRNIKKVFLVDQKKSLKEILNERK